MNYEKAEIFESQGYNIYNLSSDFYNDKCTRANINENDIVIEDRIEDIYPHNISFCPNKCQLNYVDITSKRFNCSCNVSFTNEMDIPYNNNNNEDIIEIDEFKNSFLTYILDGLNYDIIKCTKIFLKVKLIDYVTNIGFMLGFVITIFNLVNMFIFFLYFLRKLRIEIYKLVPNKKKLIEKIKKSMSNNVDLGGQSSNSLIAYNLNTKVLKIKNNNKINSLENKKSKDKYILTKADLNTKSKYNKLNKIKNQRANFL